MSKIVFEIFKNSAELTSFKPDDSLSLLLEFNGNCEGLVSIDGIVSPVQNGVCKFDSRLIDRGEHQPVLILKDEVIKLPGIVKSAGRIHPAMCSDEYTRDISIRERRLSARVEALEMQLKAIESKITRTIF